MGAAMRYQPQGRAQIDRSNPLGAKVIECLPFNGQMTTAVSRAPIALLAGGSKALGPRGYNLRANGSAAAASVPLNLAACNKISIGFWYFWDSYPGTDTGLLMEYGATYSTNFGFIIDPNNASPQAFMFGVGGSPGSPGSNLVTCARPSAGTWHRVLLTFDRSAAVGASGTAYIDGVAQAMSAFSGSSATTGNFGNDTLHLFSRNDASIFGKGNLETVTIYNGILTASEAAQDNLNAYQIFGAGSSSSAYQAAIASANASSGGVVATNTPVNPASASLGLTGYAPTVVRGASVTIGPAPGGLSIAGYAPAVTQGTTTSVVPGFGALSIAGYAPSITQSINASIAPGSASLALTGYAPTVARTANQSQTPQPGALTITGYAPTVVRLAAQSIQLPVSSMAVRGYAPSVVQSAPVIAVSVRFNILPRNFNLKTTHFSN